MNVDIKISAINENDELPLEASNIAYIEICNIMGLKRRKYFYSSGHVS